MILSIETNTPETAVPAKIACIYSFGSFPADPIRLPPMSPSAKPHVTTDATANAKLPCGLFAHQLVQATTGVTINERMNIEKPTFILSLKLGFLHELTMRSSNTSTDELM
uniref:Uncharacterized protein n=1 Tax=Opuntia streptacantha TaxID=393608 RepID=A0A7C9DLL6_OPUST